MDPAADPPLLEIEDLSVSYVTRAGEIPAVVDLSLTVRAGESVGLVGESGCGKSTVAMAIMGDLGRNGGIVGGSIRFKGRDLARLGARELRRLRGSEVAMVYQEPMAALNPSLTIGSQLIEVPITHRGAGRKEAFALAVEMLAEVKLPDPERVMAAYPHQISGGQQQRVVIAMALLGEPSLLLLDEPTTALDVTVEAGIVDLLRELSTRFGTALVYVSHNIGLLLETCERVSVIYAGQVVEEGRIRDVFASPLHPYTRGLFGCIPRPGSDKNAVPLTPIRGRLPRPGERPRGCLFGPRCDHFRGGLCDRAPVGMEPGGTAAHRVRCLRWREIPAATATPETSGRERIVFGEELLRATALQKHYPVRDRSLAAMVAGRTVRYVKANETLDLDARVRETVAIVGESGCGKSTFARVLMGLETATGGELRFAGEEIGRLPVGRRRRAQLASLQMVFQNPGETLNPSRSIGSQIERVIARLAGTSDRVATRNRMMDLLESVNLPREFCERLPRQLSGGQKQRVGIARAFAADPRLVVADEPVSALDVSVAAAVTELLLDIQRRCGTTLLVISHDLGIVRYLADRIVVMYLGRIMETGTSEQVFAPPYHPYTEALLSAMPIADPDVEKRRIVLEGMPPSPLDPPTGCPFAARCPRKVGDICDTEPPPRKSAYPNHVIACHIPLEQLIEVEPVFRTVRNRAPE